VPQKAAETRSCWSKNKSASTQKRVSGGDFSLEIAERREGVATLRVTGQKANALFANEAGGHRWQRIPPNEKRGRVQTSTITVAVLEELSEHEVVIDPGDVDESTCRGSGNGGQHRQKTDSAVRLVHRPSGIIVRCESERSQHQNRATAWALLRARIGALEREKKLAAREADRRAQVGSGQRGDKRRTVRTQDDVTVDHVTGKRMSTRLYQRGMIEKLA
jgi:peptide chain release factor 1